MLLMLLELVLMYGEKNDLKVSFQLSIPSKNSSEGGSSEGNDTVIDTLEASSIESGISLANRIYKQKA